MTLTYGYNQLYCFIVLSTKSTLAQQKAFWQGAAAASMFV